MNGLLADANCLRLDAKLQPKSLHLLIQYRVKAAGAWHRSLLGKCEHRLATRARRNSDEPLPI
ncbi:hypothetical protein AF71_00005110 [Rhizobium sp. 57MFTsu3.2]|nr:hypothetical protein [Rhizobium sp. 57MFTsu3.2]